jgi:REP element-mobilizing transposase RayT
VFLVINSIVVDKILTEYVNLIFCQTPDLIITPTDLTITLKIVEGHLMRDYVHMCLSIHPKLAVSRVVGHSKDKNAINIARRIKGRQRNYNG